jgi:CheY-like chemotaxis protein
LADIKDLVLVDNPTDVFTILGIKDPENDGQKFDLILMDIFMEKSDGIKTLEMIKSVDVIKDIPFIVVTGNTNLEDMLSAFEVGVTDYIIKPIDEKIELIARVNSAVNLKKEFDKNLLLMEGRIRRTVLYVNGKMTTKYSEGH